MNRILLIGLFCVGCAMVLVGQQPTNRPISVAELKYLSLHKDSVLNQLKFYHKLETQQNAPNKYQPERIALVREYLLQFDYLSTQLNVVSFKPNEVVKIVGKPDSNYIELGNRIYLYTALNKPYLRIKNLKYRLVFTNQQLVQVSRN